MRCLAVRPAAAMPEETGWVLVPLPEHISSANAEQVRNRLVRAIDRGAAVLVADLTATLSCDPSGAGALLDAYQRSVAAGTELRLVVTAEAVRRALRLGGLAHLALMFPTAGAALADLRDSRRRLPGQVLKIAAMSLDGPAAEEPGHAPEADIALLDSAVGRVLEVALSLHDAAGLSPERIAEALDNLDGAVRDIRGYAFAVDGRGRQPGTAARRPPGMSERVAREAKRSAALRRQLAVTARALHTASAEAAALTAQRRRLVEEPHRIDYPTQIKRWQTIADAAQRMAEIYEDA
jgi:anti-anti-sigma factor